MNTTEEKLMSEAIAQGKTEIEFKAKDVSNTVLMVHLMQQEYLLLKKNNLTVSHDTYLELKEHILENREKYKNHAFYKYMDFSEEGILKVHVKSWPRTVSKFANEHYKEYRKELAIKQKADKLKAAELKKAEKKEKKASGINSRSKGIRGEQAITKMLQVVVDKVYLAMSHLEPANFTETPQLQRNTLQSDGGGYDIVGIDFLALEVKNAATLSLDAWWKQTTQQCGEEQEPVLIYKAGRGTWRVQMMGEIPVGYDDQVGERKVTCKVDISEDTFLIWFEARLKFSLGLLLG